MIKKANLLLYCCLLVLLINFNSSASENIQISADRVEYHGEDLKILEAKGNVHIARLGETLTADSVNYNTETKKLEAVGNVVYDDNTGTTITAKKLELEGDFKKAVIYSLEMKNKDGLTIRADSANKLDETHYDIQDAFYTPCEICGDQTAIWSLKADEVNLDEKKKHISYKNLKFYAGRLPILFTPYFSHPIKGAQRESGFLRISAGMNSNIGTFIRIPYYFNLATDRDATFTIIPTSKSGSIYSAEYRHLTDLGMFSINPLFTQPKLNNPGTSDFKDRTLYNIKSKGHFAFSEQFKVNFNVDYTSHKNFLKIYNFSKADYTRSNISTDYNSGLNYFRTESLYFQNLRDGQDRDGNPLVLPHLMGNYEEYIGDSNYKYYINSDFLYFHKYDSHTINRISINNGLKNSTYFENGHYLSLKSNFRTDMYFYSVESGTLPGKNNESDQNRIIPEIQSEWRYPNFTNIKKTLIIIEPIIQAKVTPAKNYNKNIYNEDSQDSELSFSNLFANSKFSGLDIVERGTRINYGVRSNAFIATKTNIGLMMGQSYSTQKYYINDLEEKDFDKKLSNYIGTISLNHQDRYILSYKFKLDYKTLANNSSELNFAYQTQPLFYNIQLVSYKKFINQFSNNNDSRKELNFEIGTKYIKDWYFSLKARNNLNRRFSQDFKRGILNMESNITYMHDCAGLNIKIYRDFTNPVGTKPSNGFTFHIILKNINS